MAHKIRAGTYQELIESKASDDWVFIDIGFSEKKKTSGFLKGAGEAECLTFGCLVKRVVKEANEATDHLNLVIEAPLSVAFNKDGNPIFRKPECRKKTDNDKPEYRRWYQSGLVTMVAAGKLLRELHVRGSRKVRLFEGFLSFKSKSSRTCESHIRDVKKLRKAVLASEDCDPQDLKQCNSKRASKKHWNVLVGAAATRSWLRRSMLRWSAAIPRSPCSVSGTCQPCERALDYPAAWDDLESVPVRLAPHQIQSPPTYVPGPWHQLAGVCPIRPDQFQARESAHQAHKRQPGSITVLNVCRMHRHSRHQSHRVHYYVNTSFT